MKGISARLLTQKPCSLPRRIVLSFPPPLYRRWGDGLEQWKAEKKFIFGGPTGNSKKKRQLPCSIEPFSFTRDSNFS
ncbi:hypothetical protein CEXT_799531 [Caerostris extrusa]|uniref:Uncharacterized protein n=1 Tax=Caerostris extrusa TaxID=172846 RepID=A0AAV4XFI5_CAEEX|nr:hypothetical protein CEXT_799531 [Caerostris extrusa]